MIEQELPIAKAQLIGLIKEYLEDGDQNNLGQTIYQLISISQGKWFALLSLDHVIPEPDDTKFENIIETLLTSYLLACSEKHIQPDPNVKYFLESIKKLGIAFSSIRKSLERLGVWEKPGIKVVFRLASLVADQTRLVVGRVLDDAQNNGFFEPMSMVLSDTNYAPLDGSHVSNIGVIEGLTESLQLILAFCVSRYQGDYYGSIEGVNSPYNDNDFRKLITLAHVWKQYKHLWGNIKYKTWLTKKFNGDNDIVTFGPSDEADFIRHEIAGIRWQRIKSDIGLHATQFSTFMKLSNSPENIDALSKSIELPEVGKPWDGNINITLLKIAIENTHTSVIAEILLEYYYYKGFLENVVVGSSKNRISWLVYKKVINVLRVIAEIFRNAINNKFSINNNFDPLREVLLVRKTDLVEILISTINEAPEICSKAVEALVFDPQNRHLEVWDTPLIPAQAEIILFVPSIVENGSEDRTAENFISQWNEHLFTKRGKLLEHELIKFFQSKKVPVEGPVYLDLNDNRHIEFDLVLWWEDYLFLIEAKCGKSIYNGFDAYRAEEHINQAINQLLIRRQVLQEEWEKFVGSAKTLNLPPSLPPDNHIITVVVTNLLEFTSLTRDGVVVTDDFCLRRFFESPDIEMYKGDKLIKKVGRIRKYNRPTPLEIRSYLTMPPQLINIGQGIRTEYLPLPTVFDTDPKFGYLHATFSFSDLSSFSLKRNSLKKKRKRWSKHN